MRIERLALVALVALVSGAAVLGPRVVGAGPAPAVKWGPAPPFLPAGARIAVMAGDPSAAGEFTIRLEFPAGYVIRPHWHPTDEHVTVISGRFLVGMGDKVDRKQTMTLDPGGFVTASAQAAHFAIAARKTVVQVNAEGPFSITYVNPADDPRGAAATH